ncbi:ATP-binding protein [Legionella sp. CNM-4043-24]|uniref:ATP-binding protein n=1 Tax=Legionella sp. CNM-4043-24 TaxID=3421646 RepID=UPI00403AD901
MKDTLYWKERQFTDDLLNLLPTAVFWKDVNSIFLGCNTQFARLAGLTSPQEIIGKTDYDLPWGAELADMFIKDDKDVLFHEKAKTNIEEELILANKSKIFLLTSKVPLFSSSGQLMGILGIFHDITERKNMEMSLVRAKELSETANKAKTEFLANMRHDIRTPLSGIVGFSEILKLEAQEPRIKEYADNLIASSHALLTLMDEVLEAVRVSSGEIPILKRKFNIGQTLNHIIALYAARAREKNLDLTLSLDPRLPDYAIGDKIRLHRIVLELVGNALNFTETGYVRVNASLAKHENNRLIIKITISDTGIGIPKDKQQEIYLQFKRLTPSYQGIYKGTGLGLFVVKQFMDELGGEIYVNSEPHKGTCFTCLLPLQESLLDDDTGVSSDDVLATEKPCLTTLNQYKRAVDSEKTSGNATTRVLVVEDNGIAQMAAKTLLTALSCQVDIAANGMDALALCKKHQYDLIFMDIGLGEGLDGYEVTHYLRSMPETRNIPVIALTAHGGEENKQHCIEAGIDAVLTKPLTYAHASDMLSTFIPARSVAQAGQQKTDRLDLPDSDAELFQLGQFALLDSRQALKNCGNKAMVIELLSMMVNQEMPRDLAAMKQAYARKDYDSVEKTAHKIKSGAVYVGTTRMKYACQYLERYWKSGERELLDALYHQAISVIEETCLYVSAWLAKE